MATVPCPGCGLPRVVSEMGTKPCPVCETAPLPASDMLASEVVPTDAPLARKVTEPDPPHSLPTDASSLAASRATRTRPSWAIVGGVGLGLGALFGAGAVLAVQSLARPGGEEPAAAERTVYEPIRPTVAPGPPRQPATPVTIETAPPPRLVKLPEPPVRVTTVELNDPTGSYIAPHAPRKGERIVLRGRVKTLRVLALDHGTVLDASALHAEIISVANKIDGRSTLKLNAPNGGIQFTGWVGGGSVVEVNAPGGEVKFSNATVDGKPGSKIDGGANVSIIGRSVEFKGDITGTDTKVSVVLTRAARLKVASVSGQAAVAYQFPAGERDTPDVTVGRVAPTATFGPQE